MWKSGVIRLLKEGSSKIIVFLVFFQLWTFSSEVVVKAIAAPVPLDSLP
jgi:hypothetical protein